MSNIKFVKGNVVDALLRGKLTFGSAMKCKLKMRKESSWCEEWYQ